MDKYTIDKAKFLSFHKTLQPESSTFVYQTFTDCKTATKAFKAAGKRDPLACTFTATPEEALVRLQPLQDAGAGIFVQMNVSTGRGKDNVIKLSTFFLDTDGAPVQPIIKAMPRPLMVVTSSKGNYHIYWRTEDPLENFKTTQKSLAQSFACDEAMVNLDRVVRIPGSWHLKDPKNPTQVGITIGENKLFTSKDLISSAPEYVPQATSATSATSMLDAMNVQGEGFSMPDELPEGDRTHHLVSYAGLLVAQGFSAEECEQRVKSMMLEKLPEGQAPIPDHILEQEIFPSIHNFISRDRPQQAVQQSSWVAAEEVSLPMPSDGSLPLPATSSDDDLMSLGEFLDIFYFVEMGSRIVKVSNDEMQHEYKIEEFRNAFGNRKIGKVTLAKSWLECLERKTVHDIMYHPDKPFLYEDNGVRLINNYKPNNLPIVDDAHPAQLQPFLDHMEYMFPDQVDRHTFLCWMAWTIKYPARRVPWTPFIISAPGCGKGWIAEVLKVLVGKHNYAVIGPKDLDGGFNEFMYENTLLVIDELKTGGKHQYELVETLKPLITETQVAVNVKFGVKGTYPTYVNVLCFSNHDNALPLDNLDRRFWVYKVLAGPKAADHYDKLFRWLDTQGPAHLHKWLMNYDIGKFNMNAAPAATVAKATMALQFESDVATELREAIEDRRGPFRVDVVSKVIFDKYLEDLLSVDRLSSVEKKFSKMFRMKHCANRNVTDQRVRVEYGPAGNKQEPVIIRNFEKWVDQSPTELAAEMKRAWKLSLGENPAANLSEVIKEPNHE